LPFCGNSLACFVFRAPLDAGIDDAEEASRTMKAAFLSLTPTGAPARWPCKLRKQVISAIFPALDELEKVTGLVAQPFSLLARADRIQRGFTRVITKEIASQLSRKQHS
jgi:hypothetical protein